MTNLLIFVVGVLLTSSVGVLSIERNLLLDRGDNKLSAKFSVKYERYRNRIGVHLYASDKGFRVKSLRNRHLVSTQVLPDKKSHLIGILNTAFLQYNYNDYVIPRNLYGEATNSITDPNTFRSFVKKLQQTSAQTQAKSAYQVAFRRLSAMLESRAILQASEALGEAGITGSSHPYMLPLYMFATRLPHAARQQQQQDWRSLREEWASYQCKRPVENECRGMCGYGCNCWKLVCGDCCFHKGCYEHDICCIGSKYFTSRCLFPFYYGFKCDSYSGYSGCL